MPLKWVKRTRRPEAESAGAAGQSPARRGWLDSLRSACLTRSNMAVAVDEERNHLAEELARARERIAELTRLQVELTGTVVRLTELASTDVLTGLNNRRRLDEALQANCSLAIRQNSTLSIIMLDVDWFKAYNDTYGHCAGDAVLCIVAQSLLRFSNDYDVAARIGGEEFALLLPTADESQALSRAEALRSAIESYNWAKRPVTASFGVATLDPDGGDPAHLLHQADRALYASKNRGRNRVTHWRELAGDVGVNEDSESGFSEAAPPARDGAAEDQAVAFSGDLPSSPSSQPSASASANPFDRFLYELRDGRKPCDDRRIALAAIQAGIEADIVFAWSIRNDEVLEIVGDDPPGAAWCLRVVEMLRAQLPQGGVWTNSGPKPIWSPGDHKSLASALCFASEQSHPIRIVAVRLGNAQPFTASEHRLAQLAWGLELEKNRHARVHVNLKETLFGTIRCLSTAIDAKDPYTRGHSERVARIAVRLGKEMGLSDGEGCDLYLAGLLHDVGKIGSRDEVLLKPSSLTAEEYSHIQNHPVVGERIVASVPRLAYLSPGIRGHHERLDGKGYPDGLAGEAIPLMARILAVADSCDAMMSHRRYRPGLSQARIEAIFRKGAGTQWDPRIVESFFSCRYEIYEVCERGLGKSVYVAVERAARGG